MFILCIGVHVICIHRCMYIHSNSRRKYEEKELDCRKLGGLPCQASLELYRRKKGWLVKKRCLFVSLSVHIRALSSHPNSLCLCPCLVTWPGQSLDYGLLKTLFHITVSIILYWSYSIFKREIVIFLNSWSYRPKAACKALLNCLCWEVLNVPDRPCLTFR